ncbi:MAG: hypothetical protein GQ577_02475 [Woeseiaceae bacterium]|nr:hypothetical protein [Woeseiaceae bacterium]
MVTPIERRATPGGLVSATTRRAGPIYSPAALSFAGVTMLRGTHSALLDEQIGAGSDLVPGITRP